MVHTPAPTLQASCARPTTAARVCLYTTIATAPVTAATERCVRAASACRAPTSAPCECDAPPPKRGGLVVGRGGLAKAWHAPTHTHALIGSVRVTAGVCSGWRAHAQRCKCPARRGRATEGTDSAADPLPPLHPDPRPPPPFTWPSLAVATMKAAAAVEQFAWVANASSAPMRIFPVGLRQTAATD